jgi:recombination protein RecA
LKEHPDMAKDLDKRLRELLLSKPVEADETVKKADAE